MDFFKGHAHICIDLRPFILWLPPSPSGLPYFLAADHLNQWSPHSTSTSITHCCVVYQTLPCFFICLRFYYLFCLLWSIILGQHGFDCSLLSSACSSRHVVNSWVEDSKKLFKSLRFKHLFNIHTGQYHFNVWHILQPCSDQNAFIFVLALPSSQWQTRDIGSRFPPWPLSWILGPASCYSISKDFLQDGS